MPSPAEEMRDSYRKKPVVIQAYQHQGNPFTAPMWLRNAIMQGSVKAHPNAIECLEITTLEGQMIANRGDWIIRGVKGELYPCKPDIFQATYEPAEGSAADEPTCPSCGSPDCPFCAPAPLGDEGLRKIVDEIIAGGVRRSDGTFDGLAVSGMLLEAMRRVQALSRHPLPAATDGWQPIETAPKDRVILGMMPDSTFHAMRWVPQEKPHHDKAGWIMAPPGHFRLEPVSWLDSPIAGDERIRKALQKIKTMCVGDGWDRSEHMQTDLRLAIADIIDAALASPPADTSAEKKT